MHNIVGYIGLGKMGLNMASRLIKRGWQIVAYDPSAKASISAGKKGAVIKRSIFEMVEAIPKPRIIIDGGNSYFEDSVKHYKILKSKKIGFLDAGISGGPSGALNGACVMVGGEAGVF